MPVLSNEIPDQSDRPRDVPPPRRRRRRKVLIVTLAAGLVAFCGLTARLFVFPASGMPARVDAIVMLNGSATGDRFRTAFNLGYAHRAPVLLISSGNSFGPPDGSCGPQIPHLKVICFNPNPPTTQGEVEYVGRLARQHHWHSIALVTITPQDSRARLRMERCFSGHVYVMTAPIPWEMWPYQLAYEWAATVKALTVNTAC